jgi:hypothetical protein
LGNFAGVHGVEAAGTACRYHQTSTSASSTKTKGMRRGGPLSILVEQAIRNNRARGPKASMPTEEEMGRGVVAVRW